MVATLKGPYGQTSLEPAPYPYAIGRSPDNQVMVNDSKVSSHHAQIRQQGQGYEVIDLGSSNGTFVNEERLMPNVPRALSSGDQIRVGDTILAFDAGTNAAQPPLAPTVYAGPGQSGFSYAPAVAAPPPVYNVNPAGPQPAAYASPPPFAAPPPPYPAASYGVQPGAYTPPPPPPGKKAGRRGLWIIVGVVIALLLIGGGVAFAVVYNANRSTPTKTLTAFCSALRGGDYQTAYNQLSSGLQARYGSEAAFAAAFSNNGGLGKVTACTVSNANDGAGKGTINYSLSGGSRLVVDYSLIDESGASKINAQNPHSSPALTLNAYCDALSSGDYQTAYNQFSKSLQSQLGTESQFASSATADKIKGCTVSTVNDAGATGTVTYVRSDGNKTSATDSLVNEQGTWKINAQQAISTPTETLLTYCSALEQKDYQAAYNQLSSNAQSQETEAQFANNFNNVTVTGCQVSNVNDTAGTGSITYTLNGTQSGTFDYTLVNEQSVWKIDTERKHT